ncbi:MAG TPA: SIS domain-containing protein [Leptospiraceae bacterium]|nr:SIS domain-containing protein [Leptospirales bacterium]HMU82317.1 SIS domain-containing protein [Leptospiraceae bacterium]HMW60528.1 SIS domain-containing protein [Leptospiraceae bacterium]HMX58278.1 SIS domain-containing protein [Leptospiraceae bacterium]HMY46767.1 SIS domain-containing protein [Leptospiraceae bacterium]
MSSFSRTFMDEVIDVSNKIDCDRIETIARGLAQVRENQGRVFFLGVGGSAGNCGHAVNDFRKICGIECYAPTDNVSELTARTNDEGFEHIFSAWLKTSRLGPKDAIFIFSVGGGNSEKNISVNLVHAIEFAKERGATIFGVVGKDGGHTGKSSSNVVIIPTVNADHITPITEAYQAVVWHLLVTHPALKFNETKWESTK